MIAELVMTKIIILDCKICYNLKEYRSEDNNIALGNSCGCL